MLKQMKLGMRLILSYVVIGLFTALTGSVGYYYTGFVGEKGEEVGIKLAPLGDAAMEIKLTATHAHLVFEEIMAGDTGESIDQVWELLGDKEGTLFYCDAILAGGENEEGTFHKSEDPEVISKIKEVRQLVEEFIASAQTRYETRTSQAGTGSGADQQFDESYEQIIEGLDSLKKDETIGKDITCMELIGDAKFTLADAHLFFEEYLAGDPSIKYDGSDGVRNSFEKGKSFIEQLNSKCGGKASGLIKATSSFIDAADERNKNNSSESSAGSEVDEAFDQQFEKFISKADEAEEVVHKSMDAGAQELFDGESSAKLMLIVITLIAIIASIVMGAFTANSILTPVENAVDAADKIAGGDFTVQLDTTRGDEIGQLNKALNSMVTHLEQDQKKISDNLDRTVNILQNVEATSEVINTSSTQISSATTSLSQGATEQAASLEEMASSIREVSSQTKATAENARSVNEIAQESQTAADNGNRHMNEMVGAMGEISESSQQISKIIKVIDDIAFQTNLLALNAAVEAARAGKHGKGFAVVAEEVRSLAARSAKAARETSDLIEGSTKNVTRGADIAQRTADSLAEITEKTKQVHSVIGEISAAAQQQSTGISQIDIGLEQLQTATQQNAAHAEEMASSVMELSAKTSDLQRMLEVNNSGGKVKKQEPVRNIVPPVKKTLPPSSDSDGIWGEDSSPKPSNEEIISLDDNDFGKY